MACVYSLVPGTTASEMTGDAQYGSSVTWLKPTKDRHTKNARYNLRLNFIPIEGLVHLNILDTSSGILDLQARSNLHLLHGNPEC